MTRRNTSTWREVPFKARRDIYGSALRITVNSGESSYLDAVDVVCHERKEYVTPQALHEKDDTGIR